MAYMTEREVLDLEGPLDDGPEGAALRAVSGWGPAVPMEPGPDVGLAVVCSKGSLDMAYPALMLAWAAREEGTDAVLYFTMWGLDVVRRRTVDRLHPALLGNPSNPVPSWIQAFPGMEALGTRRMRRRAERMELPRIRELLELLDRSGVRMYACELSMGLFGLDPDDLLPQVRGLMSASGFMEEARGARLLFV